MLTTSSPVHLAVQPDTSAVTRASVAEWVREQLATTERRLLSPYLTDARRARLHRRVVDLQKLLEVTRG